MESQSETTNESAYTPKPWVVEEDGDGLLIRMEALAGVDEYLAVYASPDKGRREADAYLIAAAPDLYEALARVMTWIGNWSPSFTEDEEWAADDQAASAALAKARGQS